MIHNKIKGTIIGLLIGSTLVGSIVFAKSGSQWIEASYDNIKLYVNGIKVDTSSNEPFIYNGSTYLPVRAVAEALGQSVNWDGNTKSVYIGSTSNTTTYLVDACPLYQSEVCRTYTKQNGETFYMSGMEYSNGFTLGNDGGFALFNLNGKYASMEFSIGHLDGTSMNESNVYFYIDGNLVEEIKINPYDMPQAISIPLNYGMQLKVIKSSEHTPEEIALGNIIVK